MVGSLGSGSGWSSGGYPQVIILAGGRGSRMSEFLGSSVPKCLLPLGGNPLIYYPLKTLHNHGVKEVIVITQEKRDDIRRAVLQLGQRIGLIIEVFGVPEDSEDFGTAESLRLLMAAKNITREALLLLSCDTVGDLPLTQLLDLHNLKDSSFTSLYMSPLLPPEGTGKPPGIKTQLTQERDIVGTEGGGDGKGQGRGVVLMTSEADLDEVLELPGKVLKAHPRFSLTTTLLDTHAYVIRKSVLDKHLSEPILDGGKAISLTGEFLPWVVQEEEHASFALIQNDRKAIRINSLRNFTTLVQNLEWLRSNFSGSSVSLRGKETRIGKGSKLVGVTLGDHTQVGEGVKLTNVITLDHVKIEDKAELSHCLLSSNAQIGDGAVLTHCLVGPKYQVPSKGKHTNEQLTVVEDAFFEP